MGKDYSLTKGDSSPTQSKIRKASSRQKQDKKGLMPLTSIGLIILILSVSLVGYYNWQDHTESIESTNYSAESSVLTEVSGKKSDLKRQAKKSVNYALWKTGKNSIIKKDSRESWAEHLAELNLRNRLTHISTRQKKDLNPELKLERGRVDVELTEKKGGYPNAKVKLPSGTSILGSLPDNSFTLDIPSSELKTPINSRFYLMKHRMDDFGEGLNEIEKRWKFAEYALAYAQAWAGKRLTLNKRRSRALFQLALASHEIDKFGSTDYRAIIKDITEIPGFDRIIDGYNPNTVIDPIEKNRINELKAKIESSRSSIETGKKSLRRALPKIEKIAIFRTEKFISTKKKEISNLKEKADDGDFKEIREKFKKICNEFKDKYSSPSKNSEAALKRIRNAKKSVIRARKNFRKSMDWMERKSNENPMIKQLHEDFTKSKGTPGVYKQVGWGVNNALDNLRKIESEVIALKENLDGNKKPKDIFPAKFYTQLKKASIEENREKINEILSEALESSEKAFQIFEDRIEDDITRADETYRISKEIIDKQTRTPDPNWEKEHKKYPGPDESYDKPPVKKTARKYVIHRGKGTIGGLEKLMSNVISHLNRLEDLGESFEDKKSGAKEFEINEDLKERLNRDLTSINQEGLTREDTYEISPPLPLKSNPGLSVYHEVEIEEVLYDREDPVGRVYESAPTPIHLWFIGTTIYWAQWNVKIKLDGSILEEIFDYKNKNILRPATEKSETYLHKPLPYKEKFHKDKFSFRLVVLTLRPFKISTG